MHSVWSGYITFGLVNIPVKAVAARASHDLQLTGLHAACGTPVKQRRHCPACGEEAAAETMVRGVKVTADRYALVSPEELLSLVTPAKKRLELLEFVDLDQVDPVYFE
jgi:DNA end-binding protein Ku